MVTVLNFIRYSLIVVGAVGSILMGEISSYAEFTFFVLLFILVGQVRDRWISIRFHGLFIIIESGLVLWMSWQFGGAIVLLFFSILFSMFVRSVPYRRVLMVMQ